MIRFPKKWTARTTGQVAEAPQQESQQPPNEDRFIFWADWNYDPAIHPSQVVLKLVPTRLGMSYGYESSPCWLMRWDRQFKRASLLGLDGRWYWMDDPEQLPVPEADLDGLCIPADLAQLVATKFGHPDVLENPQVVTLEHVF